MLAHILKKKIEQNGFQRIPLIAYIVKKYLLEILISRLPESAGRACIVPDFDIAENRLDVVLILPPIGVDSALFQLLGSVYQSASSENRIFSLRRE